MNPDWPPTFNIIYVAGTARPFADFARALAAHSPFRFRLVSNGCPAEEERFLADSAAIHPRFEFASLSSTTTLAHGEALQRLFVAENDPYFACIDSDIFARGPILTEAQALLDTHAALFSGLPTWLAPEEQLMPARFVFMGGRFTQTDDGRCLGASYCAIYRRAALESVMERTGVSFHRRRWSELSAEQHALLAKMKVAKRRYDTMKLVNIMLGHAGFSLVVYRDDNLLHLGGLSNFAMRPSSLVDRITWTIREIVEANWPSSVPRRTALERDTTHEVFRRRRVVEDYFHHVLAGGPVEGGPAPSFPASGRRQLVELGREILVLKKRYATNDGTG